jgi:hypothetical protein
MPIAGELEEEVVATRVTRVVIPRSPSPERIPTSNAEYSYPLRSDTFPSNPIVKKMSKSNLFKATILGVLIITCFAIMLGACFLFLLLIGNTKSLFYYFKYCTIENNIDFCSDADCSIRNPILDSSFINSTLVAERAGAPVTFYLNQNKQQLNVSMNPLVGWRIEYDLIKQNAGQNDSITHFNVEFSKQFQFGFFRIQRDESSILIKSEYWVLCLAKRD